MSRDSRDKLALIVATVVATAVLMSARGLSFPAEDAVNPLVIAGLLAAGAIWYRRKGEETFVLCLSALLQVTLYTACYSVLMYAVAALGRPLVDDSLRHADAALGVHVPALVDWSRSHPEIERLLQLAYNSLLWQTPAVIVLLGFTGDSRRLTGFVRQFMLSTLACAVIFALWPAEGPFSAYRFSPSATQARYLEHLHSLRDGARTLITWRGAEGLITFPSFHTCWAILLAWSVSGRRFLFPLAVVLNGAVIVSTMTTGWHYFADVLGGIGLAVGAIAVSTVWERRLAWGATEPAASRPTGLQPDLRLPPVGDTELARA